jgi:L,D-peptidoglycan transpeptidase YkuD (ErfK/YbiS/YcfS/YnhG family)
MPLRRIAVLLLSLSLAACAHRATLPSADAQHWAKARQMVLVTSADWDATAGELRRFEREGDGDGWTQVGDAMPVTLGRNGSGWGLGLNPQRGDGPVKREGDGKAPAGVFAIGAAFGYADTADTRLHYRAMTANDWCIDVPESNYYNRIIDRSTVKAPDLDRSSEPMRRDLHADGDQRYREGFVIEHNEGGIARQGGSCIFAHLWKGPGETTAGCTAMAPDSMAALLAWLDARRKPVFVLLPNAQYAALKHDWKLPEIAGLEGSP